MPADPVFNWILLFRRRNNAGESLSWNESSARSSLMGIRFRERFLEGRRICFVVDFNVALVQCGIIFWGIYLQRYFVCLNVIFNTVCYSDLFYLPEKELSNYTWLIYLISNVEVLMFIMKLCNLFGWKIFFNFKSE